MIRLVLATMWPLLHCHSVIFPKNGLFHHSLSNKNNNLAECLRESDVVVPCLTESAVRQLEDANEYSNIPLGEGLFLVMDHTTDGNHQPLVNGDPRETKTFFSTMGMYMERRHLLWDLDELFPGLRMQFGPPPSRSFVEFHLDHRRSVTDERYLSPGMLIMKRALLPILLGIKVNVVSLMPIIVGFLVILAKKAILLSKFSFLLSLYSVLRHQRKPLVPGGGGGGLDVGSTIVDASLGSFASLPQQ